MTFVSFGGPIDFGGSFYCDAPRSCSAVIFTTARNLCSPQLCFIPSQTLSVPSSDQPSSAFPLFIHFSHLPSAINTARPVSRPLSVCRCGYQPSLTMSSQSDITDLLDLQDKFDDVAREEHTAIGPAKHKCIAVRDALYDRRKELVMNVNYFWLKVLVNHPALSLLITDIDSRILRKLVDIDVTFAPAEHYRHADDFEIVFTFASNEYFEDASLTKRYTHSDEDGRTVSVHNIRWKDDWEERIFTRKGRTRESLSTFFRWIVEDTRDAADLGELIRREVYPRALELFFGTYAVAPMNRLKDDVDAVRQQSEVLG